MLFSQRRHAPPLEGVFIALDRALAPSWLVRRVRLANVVQDERMTVGPLGRGHSGSRARLTMVLDGELVLFAGARELVLRKGDAFVMPRIGEVVARAGTSDTLEIDWADDAPFALGRASGDARFARRTMTALTALAGALEARSGFERPLEAALAALAAEGMPFDPRAGARFEAPAGDQALADAIDATLSNLHEGPAVVSLEERLGWSRRSIARRTSELATRYSVSGGDGVDWRSLRDFYRLLLGTIFASHPDATTRGLAGILGYASADALCHAFANAGLPSPLACRALAA